MASGWTLATVACACGIGCASGQIGADAAGSRADAAVGTPDAVAPGADAAPAPPDAAVVPADAAPAPPDAAPAPPDAAPAPPDAAPCTPVWHQLLANPGFDSGRVAWVELGGTPITEAASMPIAPHAGGWAAWLAGYNGANERLVQAVDVPADAAALRLRGFRCYVTADTDGAGDAIEIRLLSAGGAPLETLERTTNAGIGTVCSWTSFELAAAAPHAGERIQLDWSATTDGAYPTSFFVDSLALEALACP